MSRPSLDPDEMDALQEVANIGMGRAGDALAQLFGTYVKLSVPRLQIIDVDQLAQSLTHMMGVHRGIAAVRQSFRCDIHGEAMVIYSRGHATSLLQLTSYESGYAGYATVQELLFDVANVLIGACICGVFDQLGRSLTFSQPSMVSEDAVPEQLLSPASLHWQAALLVEVNLSLEHHPLTAHILMLMPEESICKMKQALADMLDAL